MLLSLIQRVLASPTAVNQRQTLTSHQQGQYRHVLAIVSVFYLLSPFFVFISIKNWGLLLQREESFSPLWPVFWVPWVDYQLAIHALVIGSLTLGVIVAMFPCYRLLRVAFFLVFFMYLAALNSFGKVNHNMHAWIILGFILQFIPTWKNSFYEEKTSSTREERHLTILVFWWAQAALLLTYSMAGVGKVAGVGWQAINGQLHGLGPEALSLHIAERLLQTRETTVLGPFFIDNPWLGYPMYLATIYLQLLSIFVAFRPALHKWWAVGLMGFHIAVFVTMSIPFTENILLLALIFFFSPFEPYRSKSLAEYIKTRVVQLPGLDWIIYLLGSPGRAKQKTG
jgi:hypothetical protein